MDVEIVPNDHVARLEGWSELGPHIGIELVAVHGTIDDERRRDGVATQPGDEGLCVPLAEGRVGMKALAPSASAAQRRHVGLDRSLIYKDEAAGALTHRGLAAVAPFIPLPANVGAFAFRRHQRFF